MEQQVQQLLNGLRFLNPTPECREVVEPFLCLYTFGLCDSSGELYLPSSGECETLTTVRPVPGSGQWRCLYYPMTCFQSVDCCQRFLKLQTAIVSTI